MTGAVSQISCLRLTFVIFSIFIKHYLMFLEEDQSVFFCSYRPNEQPTCNVLIAFRISIVHRHVTCRLQSVPLCDEILELGIQDYRCACAPRTCRWIRGRVPVLSWEHLDDVSAFHRTAMALSSASSACGQSVHRGATLAIHTSRHNALRLQQTTPDRCSCRPI